MQKMTKELAIRILNGDVLGTKEQTYEAIKMAINALEVEPTRHGHWIKVGCSFFGVSRYECSVCHYTDEHNESREVPYCWQCGARMENDDNM